MCDRDSIPLAGLPAVAEPIRSAVHTHIRRRRLSERGEFCDALATLLEAGLPLTESLRSLSGGGRPRRRLVAGLLSSLDEGRSLADAVSEHGSWFDRIDVAMIRRAELAGQLETVLRSLAARYERSGQLATKLIGALLYPSVVLVVGVLVAVFLSTKTLPQLVTILEGASVDAPTLTLVVMSVGSWLAGSWPAAIIGTAFLVAASVFIPRLIERTGADTVRFVPRVVRRVRVARTLRGLADLTSTGVPLVDAIRVLIPTLGGPGAMSLARTLDHVARRAEQGEDLTDALSDGRWFDGELRSLVEVGQTSGELPAILGRIADRYERSAEPTDRPAHGPSRTGGRHRAGGLRRHRRHGRGAPDDQTPGGAQVKRLQVSMNRTAMTLVEVLAVVVILGMLAATLAVGFSGAIGKGKQDLARTSIGQLIQRLELYRLSAGEWPDPSIGLAALSSGHAAPSDSYYIEPDQLQDPWGNAFFYVVPGPDGRSYEIVSYGADGAPGGEGEDADISSAHLRDGGGE